MEHGTRSSYTNHKCRCPECKKANTEYILNYYLTTPVKEHGMQGYLRGCRCRVCADAHREIKWKSIGINITVPEFNARFKKQNGLCKICNEPLTEPVVDHNHATGEVRGILCISCNIGLGKDDDLKRLTLLSNYDTRKTAKPGICNVCGIPVSKTTMCIECARMYSNLMGNKEVIKRAIKYINKGGRI